MKKLIAIILILMFFANPLYAKTSEFTSIGINNDVFIHAVEYTLQSINDLIKQSQLNDIKYENEIGQLVCTNIENKKADKISIKNYDTATLIEFLYYMIGIKIDLINYNYAIASIPIPISDFEILYKKYSENNYTNTIFQYWLIYNLYNYYLNKIYSNPIYIEQLTNNNIDDGLILYDYAEQHPNSDFAKDILIWKSLQSLYDNIFGILNKFS